MNLKSILFKSIFLTAVILTSCSTQKKVVNYDQIADAAYASGDYSTALENYEILLKSWNEQYIQEENPYYDKAGNAALLLQYYDKAAVYLAYSMYNGTASPETYTRLIVYYREIDNFSKEMMTIEGLMEAYPDSEEAKAEHSRLFEMFAETDRWEEAAEEWTKIAGKKSTRQLELYFDVNRGLGYTEICDSLSVVLLEIDDKNAVALEWEALKYYNRAEERYQSEMTAYEQNKTNRQYLKLLDALETVNADFRRARDIFEELYTQSNEKRFATYLYNIYNRFQDEKKAAYYRERIK